jgi:hypothetical protein
MIALAKSFKVYRLLTMKSNATRMALPALQIRCNEFAAKIRKYPGKILIASKKAGSIRQNKGIAPCFHRASKNTPISILRHPIPARHPHWHRQLLPAQLHHAVTISVHTCHKEISFCHPPQHKIKEDQT